MKMDFHVDIDLQAMAKTMLEHLNHVKDLNNALEKIISSNHSSLKDVDVINTERALRESAKAGISIYLREENNGRTKS